MNQHVPRELFPEAGDEVKISGRGALAPRPDILSLLRQSTQGEGKDQKRIRKGEASNNILPTVSPDGAGRASPLAESGQSPQARRTLLFRFDDNDGRRCEQENLIGKIPDGGG